VFMVMELMLSLGEVQVLLLFVSPPLSARH
jgi:hypothetical protein